MKLGIIGGTGLYDVEKDAEFLELDTPFGRPSDAIALIRRGEHEFYFLPRHGKGHRILPSELNHRANIFALRKLGIRTVLGFSAVGSLREDIHPGDFVLPDQYIDRTKRSSEHTFFGRGIVAHISFADPACARLRSYLHSVCRRILQGQPNRVHPEGTYVNMEGPAFSTRAESNFHRMLGAHIIGMTSLAEAKLCREAGICYACLALVTDYDAWRRGPETVAVEEVLKVLNENISLSRKCIESIMREPPPDEDCACRHALDNAIITAPDTIPAQRIEELSAILPESFLADWRRRQK